MTTAERTAITPVVSQEIYDTDLKQKAIGVTVGGVLQKSNVATTASNDGYATSTQITKLDGMGAGADVTDAGNIATSIHLQTRDKDLDRWTQLISLLLAFQPVQVKIRDYEDDMHIVPLATASQMIGEVAAWDRRF